MAMNEPVAWFEQDPDMKSVWYQSEQDNPNAIPLYIHPVKELTDEEIAQEWGKFYPDVFHTHLIDFARAILKRVSEK
jgi:hypothetical protein